MAIVPVVTRGYGPPSGWTPPSLASFGPTATAAVVRANTEPQAVVHPGGSPTTVIPGDNIAAKITTAGVGGTLWFTKGIYNITGPLSPLTGQTWVLESSTGYSRTGADSVVLDGGNGALNAIVQASVANVTIKGGLWQRQGNATSAVWATAILHDGVPGAGGWLVQDAIIRDNFNGGVKFQGPSCTARRVYCTNNGRYGLNASQSDVAGPSIIEKCRISFNNTRLLNPGADASATKFVHAPGITVQECWVHDNFGFGIWSDFVADPTSAAIFRENVVETNRRSGLFFEGVKGGSQMFRNHVVNNGWDAGAIGGQASSFENCVQMRITNSDMTLGSGIRGDVSRNFVDFTMTQGVGIGGAFLLWNHPGIVPAGLPDTKNWDVHDNQWWFRSINTMRIGGLDNDTPVVLWTGNNNFYDNEYHVANPALSYWKWDTGTGQGVAKTYSQWQAFHPGDDISLVTI